LGVLLRAEAVKRLAIVALVAAVLGALAAVARVRLSWGWLP